jgi:hypothetical protein
MRSAPDRRKPVRGLERPRRIFAASFAQEARKAEIADGALNRDEGLPNVPAGASAEDDRRRGCILLKSTQFVPFSSAAKRTITPVDPESGPELRFFLASPADIVPRRFTSLAARAASPALSICLTRITSSSEGRPFGLRRFLLNNVGVICADCADDIGSNLESNVVSTLPS